VGYAKEIRPAGSVEIDFAMTHFYECDPAKIIAASIQSTMRCRSGGFGTVNQTRLATQSAMQSITAAHIAR